MSTTTTNYGLTKPLATENYDIAVSNADMDVIDAQMKANATAAANAQNTANAAIPNGLATASDQVLVSTGNATWAVKTLVQFKSWISLAAADISNLSSSVLGTALTGLSTATSTAVTATDTVLSALGKLQAQITAHLSDNTKHKQAVNITETGTNANAEGGNTSAVGAYSHAEGYGNCASSDYSHTEGEYNLTCNGILYTITAFNNTAKTITLNSATGISTSSVLQIPISSGISLTNVTITAVNGLVITLGGSPTITSSWKYAVLQNTTMYTAHSEGFSTIACGDYGSHAEGFGTVASNNSSHAEGSNTLASGGYSHAEGFQTLSNGTPSHSEGTCVLASSDNSHAEGEYNLACDGVLYAITAFDNTAKTITLTNVTNLTTNKYLQISVSNGSQVANVPITAINGLVVSLGNSPSINASWKYAILKNTSAYPTHAEGCSTVACGDCSHSEGNGTVAVGNNSHVEGYQTVAGVQESHVMGQYNKALTGNATSYSGTADAFAIGNGTSSSALANAFRVTFAGATYGLSAFNSTGADYAEYFEWSDENSNNEDRVGCFVTFDVGKKIRKAKSTDSYILGIVSATPSVIGDSCQDDWQDKYVTDNWGRVQYQNVVVPATDDIPEHTDYVPILNPDWNPNTPYIPREQRPEWSPIGIMGKLLVQDDGTCQVNSYCKSNDNGIATASDVGYRVMQRVATNIVLVLVK